MLVQLDNLLAPARAFVNREGTLLKIIFDSPLDTGLLTDQVVRMVSEKGYFAELENEFVDRALRWFGTKEIRELSEEEANVLSERWVNELADEGVIPALIDASSIRRALYETLLAVMTDAAKAGTLGEAIWNPVHLKTIGGLTSEQTGRVQMWVGAKLGNPNEP